MYRYIIIDDESLIRRGTIKKLEGLQDQVTCCGEAADGKEGIRLIEERMPDFVILDMNMPIMGGEELLPYLSGRYPDMPMIVISGYQNFDYMKQAITSKAIDYILKPFGAEEIRRTVMATIDILKNKEQLETQISCVREDREKACYDLDIKFLQNQLLGYESGSMALCSEQLKFINDTHRFVLFTLYLAVQSAKLGLEEWLRENGYSEFMVYLRHPSMIQFRFIVLFFPGGGYNRKENMEEFVKLLLLWGTQQGCSFQMGVSESHDGVSRLHEAFLETTAALDAQPVDGSESTCHFYGEPGEPLSVVWPEEEEFLFRIEAGEQERVQDMVGRLFGFYQRIPGCTLRDVKHGCERISARCRGILNYYLYQRENEDKPSHNMQAIVNTLYTLRDVQNYYEQFFKNMAGMLHTKNVYADMDVVDQVKIYIGHNYQKNLTRDFVASLFYVNSSYLSQIFRKKTGKKFIDYLNDVRIERAKELLADTDRKMYQIAKSVGYENTKYFFRVFKKKTGMTPEQYREGAAFCSGPQKARCERERDYC